MGKFKVIGLMSGTSMDGLDVAACEFVHGQNKWSFEIKSCHTFPYTNEWIDKLSSLPSADALSFSFVNVEYGHLLGRLTRAFIGQSGFLPELIASHGHTIFHQPGHGLTVQIGAGSAIAAETGLPVICDFRTTDVALGGQGAPLVPVGDSLLFSEFVACINLGGFANISMDHDGTRIAFDICPANIALNYLANKLGHDYDKDGRIARAGKVDPALLDELNHLEYYRQKRPKSLGREWLESVFLPVLGRCHCSLEDQLTTVCEHIAIQVNEAIFSDRIGLILVTGGGAHHNYLMERIKQCGSQLYYIPEDKIIDYKEALIFAFLGLLRWHGQVNVFRSVTGCRSDHSGGAIYMPA